MQVRCKNNSYNKKGRSACLKMEDTYFPLSEKTMLMTFICYYIKCSIFCFVLLVLNLDKLSRHTVNNLFL